MARPNAAQMSHFEYSTSTRIRRTMKISSLCVGAVLLATVVAAPQTVRAQVGADAELFMPFSGETKDVFGSRAGGIGFGFGGTRVREGRRIRPDIAILRADKGDNEATIIIAGAQYVRPFADKVEENARFVPFYGVGLNAMYGSVEVPADDVDESKFGVGGSVFIGASVGRRAVVEARLRALSSVADYNFSGFVLSAGIRF